MSDDVIVPKTAGELVRGPLDKVARQSYEPPKLTRLGNARDLLAGALGSIADAPPFTPFNPSQAGPG